MVRVFAAGSACQLSARIGTIFQGCCGPAADADRGWDRLNAGEFVSFRRVEADDIVETTGDHQRVGRRGGMRGGGERRQ